MLLKMSWNEGHSLFSLVYDLLTSLINGLTTGIYNSYFIEGEEANNIS